MADRDPLTRYNRLRDDKPIITLKPKKIKPKPLIRTIKKYIKHKFMHGKSPFDRHMEDITYDEDFLGLKEFY